MVNRKVRLERHTFVADLPKKYALKMGLAHRETVDITFEDNAIVIRKINGNPQKSNIGGSD